MAKTEEKKSKQLDPETVSKLRKIVFSREREWFGRGLTAKDAAETVATCYGITIKPSQLLKLTLADRELWKKGIKSIRPSTASGLRGEQWQRIQNYIRDHRETIDPDRDTVLSLTKLLRFQGIITSAAFTQECLRLAGIELGYSSCASKAVA